MDFEEEKIEMVEETEEVEEEKPKEEEKKGKISGFVHGYDKKWLASEDQIDHPDRRLVE